MEGARKGKGEGASREGSEGEGKGSACGKPIDYTILPLDLRAFDSPSLYPLSSEGYAG